MSKTYSNENTFANLNEIKKLSEGIELVDIVNPSESCVVKLMEIVSRAKCLEQFEILDDGKYFFEQPSELESPEGVGKVRVES